MSLLSDRSITEAVRTGEVAIDPFDEAAVQPSSYDVRLDRHFLIFAGSGGVVDPAQKQEAFFQVEAEDLILRPGEFILAATREVITLGPSIAARVEGKSSLGRLGLLIHSTAGFVDPGFSGHVTLELSSVIPSPLRLHAGMKIGQLCLFSMSTPVDNPYGTAGVGSHYQGQRGPTPSRSWERFDVRKGWGHDE